MSEEKRIEEIAETMKAAAIEEMKAELVAAGYAIRLQVRGSFSQLPFDENIGGVYVHSYNNDIENLIRYTYAHLQKERKYQAMEALVVKLAKIEKESMQISSSNSNLREYYEIGESELREFVEEAKRILGEEQEAG